MWCMIIVLHCYCVFIFITGVRYVLSFIFDIVMVSWLCKDEGVHRVPDRGKCVIIAECCVGVVDV